VALRGADIYPYTWKKSLKCLTTEPVGAASGSGQQEPSKATFRQLDPAAWRLGFPSERRLGHSRGGQRAEIERGRSEDIALPGYESTCKCGADRRPSATASHQRRRD